MKKSILITLAFSMLVTLGFSQRGEKLTKEQKAEARAYYEEKVYPVKKAAHDQFLAGLSAEDKAFLVTKRAEKKAIQKESQTAKKELKALKEAGKSEEELKAAGKTTMAPIKEKQKAFTVSMEPFLERNKALIEKSIAPIKENKEIWKADQEAMKDDFLSEEVGEKREARKSGKSGKTREKSGEKAGKEGAKKQLSFVLWDGEMKKAQSGKKGGNGKQPRKGRKG